MFTPYERSTGKQMHWSLSRNADFLPYLSGNLNLFTIEIVILTSVTQEK